MAGGAVNAPGAFVNTGRNANVSAANFGRITSTAGGMFGSPRVMQLALKFAL